VAEALNWEFSTAPKSASGRSGAASTLRSKPDNSPPAPAAPAKPPSSPPRPPDELPPVDLPNRFNNPPNPPWLVPDVPPSNPPSISSIPPPDRALAPSAPVDLRLSPPVSPPNNPPRPPPLAPDLLFCMTAFAPLATATPIATLANVLIKLMVGHP